METIEQLREENAKLVAELQGYKAREERAAKMRGGIAMWMLRIYMGKDLRAAATRLIEEARSEDPVSSDAIAWTLSAGVQRVIRVGVMAALLAVFGGVLGSSLLLWQNLLIRESTSIAVAAEADVIAQGAIGHLKQAVRNYGDLTTIERKGQDPYFDPAFDTDVSRFAIAQAAKRGIDLTKQANDRVKLEPLRQRAQQR